MATWGTSALYHPGPTCSSVKSAYALQNVVAGATASLSDRGTTPGRGTRRQERLIMAEWALDTVVWPGCAR